MSPFPLRLLLIGVLWINGNDGQIKFIRTYGGKKVRGLLGSSFNFTWTFSNGVETVTWGLTDSTGAKVDVNKKFVSIGSEGPVTPPQAYVGRVSGSGSVSSGSVIFILTNIKKSDEALYGCELFPVGPYQTAFDYVELVVQEKPMITHPTNADVSYDEGSPVNLQCRATGAPNPDVRWIHNGYVKASGTNAANFTFGSIKKSDAGFYTCSANNSAGSVVKQVNVTVNYAATINHVNTSNSKSWIGQRVLLQCVADGVPLPTITWKKPDASSVKNLTATEITVDLLLRDDSYFGNYTCEAENDMGGDTRTIDLKQLRAPGSPKISVTTEAASLTVRWDPPAYDGGSNVTGYLVQIITGILGILIKNSTTSFSSREIEFIQLRRNTNYTVRVYAKNVVSYGKAAEMVTKTKFVGAPTAVSMTCQMEEDNMSMTWKQPDSNGADITRYKVYQRKGNEEKWDEIKTIENNSTHKHVVSNLEKGQLYDFVITATNKYGESLKKGSCARVKVPGGVPSVVTTTCNESDGKVTLAWNQPNRNGAAITRYKIYQKKGSEKKWTMIETVENNTHKYVVRNLQKDEVYVFLVTATNEYGESLKKGNCNGVKLPEDLKPTTEAQTGGINTVVVAGAAAAGVLLIIGVIIFGIWWKRRKSPSDDASSSGAALRSDNPYEFDDGYQDVSAPVAAARGLQAEAGPVAEPDYAQVDVSKKKRNRRPLTDEYAQVDKSKKSKKPRKQPGELNYAELDDFRPSLQPAAAAAAAAAEAAPARPLIRRPAYEGTEYADITRFGVPQPEPTYGNIPKKDVVYSNVQGI